MFKKCHKMTDSELVKLTLKNQDYFRCIIERYESKLLRYILRISSMSREDAEDVLQDVFISVYKNLNGFDRDLKFSSWVYRITYNKVVSTWRKSKNTPIIFKNEDSLELFKNIASEESILVELNNHDIQQEVKQILKSMKKEYAEILVLKFLEDKSYIEISDILKKPMGTVATLISRAKKQFKEVVKKEGTVV
jgi:RNA polymerase sigma-70 factor (ECF subfamily)